MRVRLSLTLIALVCAAGLVADDARAQTTIALVGGEVHPVSGAKIPGGTVVVKNGRIAAVGKDLALPKDAQIIDCKGKVVTPGLVEVMTQLGLVEIWLVPSSDDSSPASMDRIRAAWNAVDAIDVRSSLVGVARRHGVTSAVAMPSGGLIAGQGAWFDLIDARTPAWKDAVVGPVAMRGYAGEAGAVGGSRALGLLRLREALDDARAYASGRSAYNRNSMRKLATSRLDLEALQLVLRRRMPLFVQVHRASDILAVLQFAKKQRINVVLNGVNEGWVVADEIAAARVPVIVNPFDNLPRRFERRNSRSDNIVLLAKAGVPVVASTGTTHNVSSLRFALGNAVRAGLPPDVALRAATLNAANAVGQGRRYGSIDRGKVANLVVWTGDPLEPSSYAETILIRGVPQDTDNRQTALRDRYKKKLGL